MIHITKLQQIKQNKLKHWTRSSAVAERTHDALRHWKYC